MTQPLFFVLTGAALFGVGLYGLLLQTHPLRRVLALNVMGNGVFLVFIALARRDPLTIDPVPHAMVLTGLVISVSALAFALALIKRLARMTHESAGLAAAAPAALSSDGGEGDDSLEDDEDDPGAQDDQDDNQDDQDDQKKGASS